MAEDDEGNRIIALREPKMDLSAEETAILADVDRQVTGDQLGSMLTYCGLLGYLKPNQIEEVGSFPELIQKLLDLDDIRSGDLKLIGDLLKLADRLDLARRVPNGTVQRGSLQDVADRLTRELHHAYRKFSNMLHIPATRNPCAVDTIFCEVQLSINKWGTEDSLRQPLASYRDVVRQKNWDHSRVLLKGKSASGKTTILRKLTKDWVDGLLPEFDILIVLPMGALGPRWTVGEAVVKCLLPQDCDITAAQVDSIVHEKRERIGILFDNYEDYKASGVEDCASSSEDAQPAAETPLYIDDILRYEKLRDLFVLVATKGHGSMTEEVRTVYLHVELHGFAEKDINIYVPRFVPDRERQQNLIKFLETNDLKTLAMTPAFLQMLCQYWNTCKPLPNPPEMLTLLFHNMIWGLYSHMTRGMSSSTSCSSLASLEGFQASAPQDMGQFKSMMLALGERAVVLLLKKTQAFSLNSMKEGIDAEGRKLIDLSLKLGLLKNEDWVSTVFRLPNNSSDDESPLPEDGDDGEDTERMRFSPLSVLDSLVSFHSDHIFWYCAAIYLREVARRDFRAFEKKLEKLMKTYPRVLKLRFLFLFSFGGDSHQPTSEDRELSIKIGRHMLKRLNALMEEDIGRLRQSPNKKTEMLIFKRMNQFSKLCLQCNYEAQTGSALNRQMASCLRDGRLNLVGLSEYTTTALQYFLSHSQPRASSPQDNGTTSKFQLKSMKIVFLGDDVSMTYMKELAKHIPGGADFFQWLMGQYIHLDPKELEGILEQMMEGQFGNIRFASDLCEAKKAALLHFFQYIRRWSPHTNVLRPTVKALIKFQSPHLRVLSLMVPNVREEVWNRLFEAFQRGQFAALEDLDIGFCKLNSRQLSSFAQSFKKLSKLQVLVLSGNQLNGDIVQKIRKLQELKELGLQECGLGKDSLATLILSLNHLKKLETLDLRRNNFADEHTEEFENLLGGLTLTGLKLSLTMVNKSVRPLVTAIGKHKTLRVLHLNHCPEPLELLRFSKNLLSDLPNLVDFRLSGPLPNFRDRGACSTKPVQPKFKLSSQTLASFTGNLERSHTLETFSVLYCELDHTNFVELYETCKKNPSLKLMRYSYSALARASRNVRLFRILSEEKGEDFLQLW